MARMPDLRSLRRRTDTAPTTSTSERCRNCGQDLRLIRTHMSPARLGTPLVTHFYECCACDSGYAFSPATGKWKPWAGDGEDA
jgi:uncharacterized protein with PIN domain